MDQSIAKLLRRSQKPTFLVVNKVDNTNKNKYALEFMSLDLARFFISSVSGSGTGELLDSLIKKLPLEDELLEDTYPRFVVIEDQCR